MDVRTRLPAKRWAAAIGGIVALLVAAVVWFAADSSERIYATADDAVKARCHPAQILWDNANTVGWSDRSQAGTGFGWAATLRHDHGYHVVTCKTGRVRPGSKTIFIDQPL